MGGDPGRSGVRYCDGARAFGLAGLLPTLPSPLLTPIMHINYRNPALLDCSPIKVNLNSLDKDQVTRPAVGSSFLQVLESPGAFQTSKRELGAQVSGCLERKPLGD